MKVWVDGGLDPLRNLASFSKQGADNRCDENRTLGRETAPPFADINDLEISQRNGKRNG